MADGLPGSVGFNGRTPEFALDVNAPGPGTAPLLAAGLRGKDGAGSRRYRPHANVFSPRKGMEPVETEADISLCLASPGEPFAPGLV